MEIVKLDVQRFFSLGCEETDGENIDLKNNLPRFTFLSSKLVRATKH